MPQEETAAPPVQMWNPVDAVKQKFPEMGLSDQAIYNNLSDPAKFRSAFPEYAGLKDDEIQSNMKKIGSSNPHYQSRVGRAKAEAGRVAEKADTAITGALETNPENLKSLARTNAIEVPKTLGREVYSGLKAIGSIPGGVYHAFTDEATPEEKEKNTQFEKEVGEAPGTETSGLKRLGLGIERLTGIPAAEKAAKDYASGKVGYQQILENAPEAIGQGAGTVVGAEGLRQLGTTAAKNAPAAIGKVKEYTGPVADKLSNVGGKAARRIGYEIGKSDVGLAIDKALPTIERVAKRFGIDTGEPTAESTLKPIGSKPTAEPAPVPELKPLGIKPAKVEQLLNKSLGNEPLKPDVSLKEQGKATAEPEPEHVGQHARASGKWVNDLPKEDRATVHDLSNVEVRQLAINLGEDMGQKTVGRGKLRGEGSVTREEVFNRLLKDHKPAEIIKAIGEGKHLPTVSGGSPALDVATAQQVHGGHAGGGVSSVEELNRPGKHYVVGKMGDLTYHGKAFAPEDTPAGKAHVTVLPSGELQVNEGNLTQTGRKALMKAISQ